MLKTKVIEKIRPSKKVQHLFNSNRLNCTSVNGYIQIIERTNIKQVFPIVYKINNLIIYEFPKEYARKQFYIVNNKIAYDFNDLKDYLFNASMSILAVSLISSIVQSGFMAT